MSIGSKAIVRTPNAARYAKQVGKHWAHNLAVEEVGDLVQITFPKNARGTEYPGDAVVTLLPEGEALVCTILATAEAQRDGLKDAVARHIDRFAFREGALDYAWVDFAG